MNRLTVVMYHYIRDYQKTPYSEIKGLDVREFEGQVKYISKHYNVVTIEDVIDSVENNSELPTKAALLTFDDGYKEHFEYALPILVKNNIKGAFYAPAKAILESLVLDVNKIHFILATVKNKKDLFLELLSNVDKYREQYSLMPESNYIEAYCIENRFDSKEVVFIKRMLQVGLPEELRALITQALFKKHVTSNEYEFSKELYLSMDMIRKMKSEGMHIGSHSYEHYWLASLTEELQEKEIKKSIDFLTNVGVNTNNWTICYPYGSYNDNTLKILKKYNCKLGFTSVVDIATLNNNNRFEIPRLDTNDLPKKSLDSPNHWFEKG